MMKLPLLLFLCLILLPLSVTAQLRVGFYKSTCPRAELIVRQAIHNRFKIDPSIAAALLRMHFHDCFVTGCDASILIDSTPRKPSEKDAGPSLGVRGYDIIDEAKRTLEATCPGTVSCADIITLATREAVVLAGGPSYSVPTGRRDGRISDPSLVDLPDPSLSVPETLTFFASKGFTLKEMVTLLGAHTVGVAHCGFFQDRLTNFQGTGRPDPTMDRALVSKLLRICGTQPRSFDKDPTMFLDQNTSFVVDNQIYKQVILRKGVLQIDQELALDRSSAPIVSMFASNGRAFEQSFAKAVVKMGGVEVLVGKAGEIRTNCRVFNKKKHI
ncbi:peroxidase 44 [Diospyros lotus]|uniref:peroxidase 44 n=1 Tax=Diospyros lotus TaxID=55363 RepID=UPI0022517BDB|nr:peroxidase 44 [Diospyros lotus]